MRHAAWAILVTGCAPLFGLDRPALRDAAVSGDDGRDGGSADTPIDVMVNCQSSYVVTIGASRYRKSTGFSTWLSAALDCAGDGTGSHLVAFTNDSERTAVAAMVTMNTEPVWIGLSDRVTEGSYLWVTDDSPSYPTLAQPPWTAGAPSAGPGENCIRMLPSMPVLDDDVCANTQRYVCECDGRVDMPSHY